MAGEKIPASAMNFGQAVQLIAAAAQVLRHYSWEELHAILSDRDGMLVFRDPTLFQRVQADPQWKHKVDLIRAAADFTRAVDRIEQEIGEPVA